MTINDRENRSILIDIDDDGNVIASHGDKVIGTFEFRILFCPNLPDGITKII
jgi:hypothetical protein